MKKVKSLLQLEYFRRQKYLREDSEEIALANLKLLMGSSIAALSLLVLFLFLTPFIIKGWKITPSHIGFLPAAIALCLISFYQYRKGRVSVKKSVVLCVLFETVIFTFVILIDGVYSPSAPAVFMPVMCVAIPPLFIMPFLLNFGLLCLYEICFIACVLTFKDPMIGQYDIFASLTALGCSFIVINLIYYHRLRDHDARIKYKLLSTRDALSGLLNKQACETAVRQYLAGRSPFTGFSFLIMDLDDFKHVNDTSGHITGDQVIKDFGDVLHHVFRSTDIAGRAGGDEFMVLLKGDFSLTLLKEKCRRIQEQLNKQCLKSCGLSVSCSIGAVYISGGDLTFEDLFRQADEALYQAKAQGKARFTVREFPSPGSPISL